jgi:ribonuclease P protein component
LKFPETFTADDRLRKRSEFQRVYERGEKVFSRNFTLFLLAGEAARPRLGVTVTRRVDGAVGRNRIKRRLREWFRRRKRELPAVDLVINARPGAATVGFEALCRELDGRLRRRPVRGGTA